MDKEVAPGKVFILRGMHEFFFVAIVVVTW